MNKHYDKIIKLRKGKLYIHESGESDPLGVIIDYYDNDLDKLIDTFTIWYEEFECEDCQGSGKQ